ncbi:hypothetical protein FV222_00035 [Methylobacterium sp. WL103]|uniref:hypothetical protein n=1 Tax=Methylobacterium sp. WL103 TaxID=2603891 RepID=UPI0011C9D978|nr:hypothetical protein [Methylobacterium sp. WL103]TXN09145.1 hypothetical protein FV222_00035 [Methylobacterium sp. WL103]
MPTRHDFLLKIAGILDCSVKALQGEEPPPAHLADAGELMKLWHALERPEDRALLIAVARTVARHHRNA